MSRFQVNFFPELPSMTAAGIMFFLHITSSRKCVHYRNKVIKKTAYSESPFSVITLLQTKTRVTVDIW